MSPLNPDAPTGDLPRVPSLASFPERSPLFPLAELSMGWYNSVRNLQFGMSETVTHVIRSERETLEARVPWLRVHHYSWKSWVLNTFQFNWMTAYYTAIIYLLYTYCIPSYTVYTAWAEWSRGWTDGLGYWNLTRPATEIFNTSPMGSGITWFDPKARHNFFS